MKQENFPNPLIILRYMLFKGPWEVAVITSIVNAHVNIDILNNCLIPSIENWFGDDEVILRTIIYLVIVEMR